jgi:hypothetical protein
MDILHVSKISQSGGFYRTIPESLPIIIKALGKAAQTKIWNRSVTMKPENEEAYHPLYP